MTTQSIQRPRFDPSPCDGPSLLIPPLDAKFQSLVSCSADGLPIELFETAVTQMIDHPEYNSTLILRSQTISTNSNSNSNSQSDFPTCVPCLQEYRPVRNIHRKLVPRNPRRDAAIEQHCTLYADAAPTTSDDGFSHLLPSVLVLTPVVLEGECLPYYHPTVSHLAFRYLPSHAPTSSSPSSSSSSYSDSDSDPVLLRPTLRIEATPLPGTATDPNSRLYRTALALLETLHRYLWGALTHYEKRVHHDVLVPREVYQDVYYKMRERHKGMVNTWKEATDPLKHVFEDIGIATFLLLFWKDTFADTADLEAGTKEKLVDHDSPWTSWPRPPGGFLDLGCGNGLLTHILSIEGYSGYGMDLRSRTSWAHYPESSQAALKVHALDPTRLFLSSEFETEEAFLRRRTGVFLIGNHADELTPWLPVLATLMGASGYLSIPCCAWMFDEKFTRSSASSVDFSNDDDDDEDEGEDDRDEAAVFIASLGLGAEGTHKSQYSAYRIWLARLSRWVGWKIECETLRIPSTRNWAIVGRERLPGDQGIYVNRAKRIVEDVVRRGIFKTRTPEGKGMGRHH